MEPTLTEEAPALIVADVVPEEPKHRELNALDRCDRCGVQAYVVTRHLTRLGDGAIGESDLLWCAHHYKKHEKGLESYVVLDERFKLDVKLEAAAY